MFCRVTSLVVCLVALSGLTPARAQNPRADDFPPAELRLMPYRGALPLCEDPGVLDKIQRDYSASGAELAASGVFIAAFENVNETGFRKAGQSFIPRRDCEARAVFSDGGARRIVYDIAEDQGFLGLGPGVSWRIVEKATPR